MKGAGIFLGLKHLIESFGPEFMFYWIIGAVIVAGVIALGIAGIGYLLGYKDAWDTFKGSFLVVGVIELLILLLSDC